MQVMVTKPFRQPLKQKRFWNSQISNLDGQYDQPPLKKRRLASPAELENLHPSQVSQYNTAPKSFLGSLGHRLGLGLPRTSLLKKVEKPKSTQHEEKKVLGHESYYSVVWRKFTTKKNKTWDGDGTLAVVNGVGILTGDNGKELGRKRIDGPLLPEAILSIGSRDVQIETVMRKEDVLSGRSHLGNTTKSASSESLHRSASVSSSKSVSKSVKEQTKEDAKLEKSLRAIIPSTKATQSSFKTPVLNSTVLPKKQSEAPIPRHDPATPGAVVMQRPQAAPHGKQLVDVVIDPVLSNHLRDHQKDGVKFMYECVMGMRPFSGDGAILADEMGLGKTLQVIALLWTLMKQNPVYGDAPVVKKALIVCPVSVIKNWKKEFRKWLGKERIGVFIVEDSKARLTDFTMGKSYNVMIIGYEKVRSVAADLQKGSGIDIIIADEGHRLKTATNKSAQAIKSLTTTRRIILSGTPMQNDLSEFYFMVDFVNPGLLGKFSTFKKSFDIPIVKSRQPNATEEEIELGEARNEELGKLTGLFIIRRTADILSKYLPPKSEYVLFCRPTSVQAKVYRSVLSTPEFAAVLQAPEAALQLISILKKVCNCPSLLQAEEQEAANSNPNPLISAIIGHIPPNLLKSPGASGKLRVLDSLLHQISSATDEKVVIVSQYTATLDILSNLCASLSYNYLRLDGSTPQSKRQQLVDRFNRTTASDCFIFLLSAKSGGVGLNLVGASRLILFDNDWNPSTDLQAMARIHRDGQTRPCQIYRLLTKGALDEKIFQRQATKLSLADSVVDGKVSASTFSREELRDLFRLDESDKCQTHELLGCLCGGGGVAHATGPDPAERLEGMLKSNADVANDEKEPARIQEVEDEEDELLSLDQLVKGTQVEALRRRAALEEEKAKAARAEKEKHKMVALMQYRHVDIGKLRASHAEAEKRTSDQHEDLGRGDSGAHRETSNDTEDLSVDDAILMKVLKDPEGLISYVFAKEH